MKSLFVKSALLLTAVLGMLAGCIGSDEGGGTGACVSSPVSYSYGAVTYCYDNWSSADCSNHDANQVNGASWTFYSGQTCADRGLTPSN